jgi:hypothetical protein
MRWKNCASGWRACRESEGEVKQEHEQDRDKDIEQYLREFQPRAVRKLELERSASRTDWRRLAAAAVVLLALGTSIWFVHVSRTKVHEGTLPQVLQGDQGRQRELNNLQLTRLALDDKEQFDEALAARSRRVLPDMKDERSALRILAKE